MEQWLSISEAASMLGVSASTLRLWHRKKILIPARRLQGGKRLYSLNQIHDFISEQESNQDI